MSTHAAGAAPAMNAVDAQPSHPPYRDMITEAIQYHDEFWGAKESGTSVNDIWKYIHINYRKDDGLSENYTILVSDAISHGLDKGVFKAMKTDGYYALKKEGNDEAPKKKRAPAKRALPMKSPAKPSSKNTLPSKKDTNKKEAASNAKKTGKTANVSKTGAKATTAKKADLAKTRATSKRKRSSEESDESEAVPAKTRETSKRKRTSKESDESEE
ncbi:hypothetical protein HDU96_000193 [Phlyctochytrium bullatum]|nr:hypothetical protein HDU96_000193 [Phlyctochytrium bullatum]